MSALVYRNTKTTIPNWMPIHDEHPRGIAYETDTHFIHIYGRDSGVWVISIGLTATQKKSGTLHEWVEKTFGAKDIEQTTTDVGHTIDGVWRPGLYFDEETAQGLAYSSSELRLAEQALLLLIARLEELLHFVEPSASNLDTYSHKSRELLILACTEVENYWKQYLVKAGATAPPSGFSTNDYIKFKEPLHLGEFEISLPRYSSVAPVRPFLNWSPTPGPTKTLGWYDAYNKTKHDRTAHFDLATLQTCIDAVAANVALFSVRFGPFHLINGAGTLAAHFNQLFSLQLQNSNPKTFYAPQVELPYNQLDSLVCFGAKTLVKPRIVKPLRL